ncbi:acyl carrier protein [Streptomyces violascens]|uniref:acyl carrier protein n=1 Tax=Streptomyces violascens TaxID=67381 RepID=UPI00379C8512
MKTEQSLIRYIADNWLDGDAEGLDENTPITELNVIDSAGIFDLVHHLQDEYRVAVPLPDIAPSNFRTIRAIADLVHRLQDEDRLQQKEGAVR